MLAEKAHHNYQQGHYELVGAQLSDILETFGRDEPDIDTRLCTNNILTFPRPQ